MIKTSKEQESNQALQDMIVKVSQIRRYRIETGYDHPNTDRIWDKINDQYHSLIESDKQIFDDFIN